MILKIDCEGCEWDAFDELDEETLQRFKSIVGEFHGLEDTYRHAKYFRVMKKLLNHFRIVHTHGNCGTEIWRVDVNGSVLGMPACVEASFVRRDLSTLADCVASKYRPTLDRPNCGSSQNLDIKEDDFRLTEEIYQNS